MKKHSTQTYDKWIKIAHDWLYNYPGVDFDEFDRVYVDNNVVPPQDREDFKSFLLGVVYEHINWEKSFWEHGGDAK